MRPNTMVSNVLDMARLQSGSVRLRCEWQPLEEVVGASIRHSGAASATIRWGYSCPPICRCCTSTLCLWSGCSAICWRTPPEYHLPGSRIRLRECRTSARRSASMRQ